MGLITLWMAGGQDWPKLFRHYDRRCRGELDGEEFRRADQLAGRRANLHILGQPNTFLASDSGASGTASVAMHGSPGTYAVCLQLLRLSKGALVLSSGRPGIGLWVNAAADGEDCLGRVRRRGGAQQARASGRV